MSQNVPISQLPAASQINDADMFALEQSGTAKKLLGSLLKQFVTGPIESLTVSSVTLSPGANPTVEKTGGGANPYNIKFGLPQANSITSITKTGASGNVDTYTITFTNGTTVTFTVTNGASTVKVNDVVQSIINFDSDPQTQLDSKVDLDASNTVAFALGCDDDGVYIKYEEA